ncbi:hypothetical protein HY439_00845 [Candidatus Microgenomates bacterium]|nr:hypothetical protein [Candidatus Microgenomates bacterium]
MSEKHSKIPIIFDIKNFLSKPPGQLAEVGQLPRMPDIDLIRWLPTLNYDAGLVLQDSTWYVIRASTMGLPRWQMPHNSEILLHSHPYDGEDEQNDGGSIPSISDYLNCSPTAKNLIVSHRGVTQYWRVIPEKHHLLEIEIHRTNFRFGKGSKTEYLKFLDEIGAKFTVYPWEEIDEEKLSRLLNTR